MADYQGSLEQLEQIGVGVVALSTDDLEATRETVAQHGLTYPVAYGLAPSDADTIGAYRDDNRGVIQPSAFILRHGAILQATYSSGSQGRLWSADVIGLVSFLQRLEAERATT